METAKIDDSEITKIYHEITEKIVNELESGQITVEKIGIQFELYGNEMLKNQLKQLNNMNDEQLKSEIKIAYKQLRKIQRQYIEWENVANDRRHTGASERRHNKKRLAI